MHRLKSNHDVYHAIADPTRRAILDRLRTGAAPQERIVQALTSREIIDWWINPGVFDTTEWTGDVRVGGRWEASGTGRGKPYTLDGEFLEIDAPRKLVHTWRLVGTPFPTTTVTYLLEPIQGGTRITLRHTGFTVPDFCEANRIGWETSFEQLARMLSAEPAALSRKC